MRSSPSPSPSPSPARSRSLSPSPQALVAATALVNASAGSEAKRAVLDSPPAGEVSPIPPLSMSALEARTGGAGTGASEATAGRGIAPVEPDSPLRAPSAEPAERSPRTPRGSKRPLLLGGLRAHWVDSLAVDAHVALYTGASVGQAVLEILWTVAAQGIAWSLYSSSPRWALFLDSLVYLRWWAIFRDCAHLAYVPTAAANRVLGLLTSVVVGVPYDVWRRLSFEHHAHHGKLDGRGCDPLSTINLTVAQVEDLPLWSKLAVRLGRAPTLYFPAATAVDAFLKPLFVWRDPWVLIGHAWRASILFSLGEWRPYAAFFFGNLLVHVMLHLFHAVNTGYRARPSRWDANQAAMLGSAYVQVPLPLRFFTLGIEYHHVHHAGPQVPCYYAARCHNEAPAVSATPLVPCWCCD